jgi:SAM-dependent methyltransferase
MGTMEGLIPTLIARRGARSVLAVDAIPHCVEKLAAVRHYHRVEFDYQNVGLMYELDKKLPGRSFDLINCSGLLYHVVSPFMVLAGVRPLLRRNGLIVVSTNVVDTDEYMMEFNGAGRLQRELNTFWYMSIPLLDYVLRYLALAPLDVVYVSHGPHEHLRTGRNTGFLSVLCRAVDAPLSSADDTWMSPSVRESWESKALVDWERSRRNQVSAIQYHGAAAQEDLRSDTGSLDLTRAVRRAPPLHTPPNMSDTHRLALTDAS